MAIVFAQQDDCFFPTEDRSPNFHGRMPIGTYSVRHDIKMGYFLQRINDFALPSKLYGFINGRAERIINTFQDRPNSTGVILSGEKGSGKTLLVKKISLDLAEQDTITMVVDHPYHGTEFNQFIQHISQPALVIFDEYEKVYNHEEYQNALLTLFDGIYASKKLFVVTSNERGRMNSYMINRPGRFYYAFEYKGVDEASIREFLADHLKNKDHTESFVRYASTYEVFNFDMMAALIEDMNRYDESVTEAAKFVNVSQSWTTRSQYKVVKFVLKDDHEHKESFIEFMETANHGSGFAPYVQDFGLSYYYHELDDDNKPYKEYTDVTFTPLHIKSFSDGVNNIVYENEHAIAEISKIEKESFDINKYFM